jgi:hypothetical protein
LQASLGNGKSGATAVPQPSLPETSIPARGAAAQRAELRRLAEGAEKLALDSVRVFRKHT